MELQRCGSEILWLPLCPFIIPRLLILVPTASLEGAEHFRVTDVLSCPQCWDPHPVLGSPLLVIRIQTSKQPFMTPFSDIFGVLGGGGMH